MTKAMASGTIKCPHCRQPLPEGARFCLFCGALVRSPGKSTGPEPDRKRQRRQRGPSAKTAATDPDRKPATRSRR